MQSALDDYQTADVSPKLKATLALLEKTCAGTATADDVRSVRAAGVSRQAVADALDVCAVFCTLSRLADALGWVLPSRSAHEDAAKFLGPNGYKFPPPLVWLTPRV